VLLAYLNQLLPHRSTQSPHDAASLTPAQAWVLDSQPGLVTSTLDHRNGVSKVLSVVHEIPLPVPSRAWLLDHLKLQGFDTATSQWLGSNLVPKDGKLGWSFDIPGTANLYKSYMASDFMPVVEHPPPGVQLHLVQGGKSDRWSVQITSKLNQIAAQSGGAFQVHSLPKAGHWLHVDDPTGLMAIMLPRLCAAATQPTSTAAQ